MPSSFKFDLRAVAWQSTLALALLIAACFALFSYQGHAPGTAGNARTHLLERLGSQLDADPENARFTASNSLLLGANAKQATATAEWSMSTYEFAHLLPHTQSCSMSVYVVGPELSGADTHAYAQIELNGSPVARIAFRGRSPEFAVQPRRLAPAGVSPQSVPMTPLFNPKGLVFPVAAAFCRADRWNVRVRLSHARWAIARVGIVATFAPAATALAPTTATYVLALVVAGALLFGTHRLFNAVARAYGPLALGLTLLIFLCAVVTHDEWDFPVWLRFTDLIAFGHASPANMWGGSPLWPLGLGILAPLLSASYGLTGNGSHEITALFLKLAMSLATCGNAYVLSRVAPPALRRFVFPIILLSPAALYELGGGYREVFAGSLFLLGAVLSLRSRYLWSAVAFSFAASISESLIPLVFLPATLRLGIRGLDARNLTRAVLDVVAGLAPIALEWLFLIPHSVVATTLTTRVSAAYRFGGGSWLSTLDGFFKLPTWVGAHSTIITVALLAAFAAPLGILLIRYLFSKRVPAPVQEKRIFAAFAGLVAAFFLAYRGVDPSTWYAFWIVVAFYLIRFESTSPFALLLSALQAVAFYAILGIGDFANATYVMPQNQSLIGVLGKPMLIAVAAVNLATLAFYVSIVLEDTSLLFGRGSLWFLMLFFGAAATSAVKFYPSDMLICSCVAGLVLVAFWRLLRLNFHANPPHRRPLLDYIGLLGAIALGVTAGLGNPGADLAGAIALLLGLSYGFKLCDIVLATCGILFVGVQYGFGWFSIAGYVVLSLLAVASVRKARVASTRGRTALEPARTAKHR